MTTYIILGLIALCTWFWFKAHTQQKRNDHRFKAIFNNTFQFTGLLSPDGTLLEANKTALEFAGLTREEIVGKPFWETRWWDIEEKEIERLRQAIRDAAQGRFVRYEVKVKSGDGSLLPIDFSIRPMEDENGNVTLLIPEGRAIQELITEREAREYNRLLFTSAFDNAPIGMALLRPDGTWFQVNQAVCDIVGYPREELLNLSFQDITHPEDLEADLGNVHKILEKEISNYSMEKRYIHKNGSIVWIQLTVSMVWNTDDSPRYFIAQIQDITQSKQLREDLDRSNRDLAQFAYIASHDLQEPLRMVSSFVSLIGEKLADSGDEELHEYIQFAVDGSERMQILIQDLLNYSHTNTKPRELEWVDLDKLIDVVQADLDAALKETGASLTREPLGSALVDTVLMRQVFQNLIANAIKFQKPERVPEIHISAERTQENLLLTVSDNGIGIAAEHHDKIFETFKRLNRREDYPGTGIGLAVCKRAIERHGGRICVNSTPGKGTTFTLSLPLPPTEN